ncbi:MAG: OmpA family protein [Cyclobacteriaceae bacterium]
MLKTALKLLLVVFVFQSNAQEADVLINVSGKIYSAKDSSVVTANILYEKLPYYDDMGMALSRAEDGFTIPLVNGNSYNFSISLGGFKDFVKEVQITGNGSNAQTEVFYIEVDEIELIKLENLIFPSSSPVISSSSYSELDELAVWMNENPQVTVQLEGHTDFRGNPTANMNLSLARVESVKEYLVKKKVKKSRILTKAFGGDQPISREDTEEAKALNRRVEVRVIRQ